MKPPDPPPNLQALPKFEALDLVLKPALYGSPEFPKIARWIEKLQAWCDAALTEMNRLDQLVDGQEEELSEALGRVEDLEWIVTALHDVRRGVRTLDEIYEVLPEEEVRDANGQPVAEYFTNKRH